MTYEVKDNPDTMSKAEHNAEVIRKAHADGNDDVTKTIFVATSAVFLGCVMHYVAFVAALVAVTTPPNVVAAVAVVIGASILYLACDRAALLVSRRTSRMVGGALTVAIWVALAVTVGNPYLWIAFIGAFALRNVGAAVAAGANLKLN